MSLQEEGPQVPQQETLQQIAARIIQKAWKRHVYREIFKYFSELISHCNHQDPRTILRTVNPREAELLDAAAGVFIRFRLGGITFPPNIYYKIFTHRPIADVCASSPKDYTQLGLKKSVARQTNNGLPLMLVDRSGWYQRMENNSWRLFCSKVAPMGEPIEIGANKKMDFHHSRLQRQQDVDRWRKKRKIEWLKQMYNHGRLQTHSAHRHMATLVGNSAQEVMATIEEKGDEEVLEWELDELLAWTNTLSFEEYMEEWRHLACSHSSEASRDVPSSPPRLEPHEFAGVADEDS
ncbi:protein MFI isoform X1 [Micropterus salmoides]|uniref:protein MFI isoform X1 n=1 Tax=Micropterus salmoides TaxID=27706 RepID=UPI0018EA635C|nr:protein MFI isoform X1 [Micropterus salmoides]